VRLRYFVLSCLVLAACAKGGGSSLIPPGQNTDGPLPLIAQRFDRALTGDVRANTKEKIIFSFDYYDGFTPWCTLLAVNGELYGTTAGGGSSYYSGTVFKVSKSGYEVTLRDLPYDFGTPMAGLISLQGWLYGTASGGVAFQIGTSGQAGWSYKVSGSPRGRLIALNGVLYGTAYAGGGNSDGSVFAITTSGQGRILYNFKGAPDGNEPISDLVALNGKLYGTTAYGGRSGGTSCPGGCGTVFEIDASGKERVVYSFSGGKDGIEPQGALAVSNGKIYGTTLFGGRGYAGGTVFEVTAAGHERILHRFDCGTGACAPEGGVIAEKGVLYGMTSGGAVGPSYNGTVFELSTSGKLRTLHSFAGYPTDGSEPLAAPVLVGHALYGTTAKGGTRDWGTVFKVTL
jgi:uncharacterized repeat protein (TIGR03803 family)